MYLLKLVDYNNKLKGVLMDLVINTLVIILPVVTVIVVIAFYLTSNSKSTSSTKVRYLPWYECDSCHELLDDCHCRQH